MQPLMAPAVQVTLRVDAAGTILVGVCIVGAAAGTAVAFVTEAPLVLEFRLLSVHKRRTVNWYDCPEVRPTAVHCVTATFVRPVQPRTAAPLPTLSTNHSEKTQLFCTPDAQDTLSVDTLGRLHTEAFIKGVVAWTNVALAALFADIACHAGNRSQAAAPGARLL